MLYKRTCLEDIDGKNGGQIFDVTLAIFGNSGFVMANDRAKSFLVEFGCSFRERV
jgi:hypothetical protein